jgi:hypothetical protein
MNYLDELLNNKVVFFRFLAETEPVFTGANVFLRDIQFGIKYFFEKKDIKLKYPEAEKLATDFINALVETGDLTVVMENTWKLNLDFKEEQQKQEEPETQSPATKN